MKVVVTGASGYIGSILRNVLRAEYSQVVALSRGREPGQYFCMNSGAQDSLAGHMEGADKVVHLAGKLVSDPGAGVLDYYEANVKLTDDVFNAAEQAGIQTLVHASSRLLYPNNLREPAVEDRDANPDTAYGISKKWAEDLLRFRSEKSGMSALSLRIAQVTGGSHHGLGVINRFFRQLQDHGAITVHGAGRAIREFVHVEDVARAFAAALKYEGGWQALNVGGTHAVSISDIATIVAGGDPGAKIIYSDVDNEDLSCYALDKQKTQEVIGWRAEWTPDQIIYAARTQTGK